MMEAKKAGGTTYRAAVKGDAPVIAALFRISSDGVADYIWSGMASEYPGLTPLEIGAVRYSSEDGNFSYKNCVVAEREGEVVGLLCTFPIPKDAEPSDTSDPVMEPYERLEAPGSFYICSLAVFDGCRGAGIGTEMLAAARRQARDRGFDTLSLLVFEKNEGAVRLYGREGFRVAGRVTVVPHEKIHHTGDVLLMVASPDEE
ncbi:MAG: GNAT family N-acetyltransferase [Actinomycetota bacterium]|nr:GNAT family N-acetyltransferase [Actinomycetota bacterium]